ncbi:hypothetical protein JW977_02840 [Candidatus Falkowbacteria bacterium]|nr:hypothetical protein [Candidatus Falkowbacteria bacterium]
MNSCLFLLPIGYLVLGALIYLSWLFSELKMGTKFLENGEKQTIKLFVGVIFWQVIISILFCFFWPLYLLLYLLSYDPA